MNFYDYVLLAVLLAAVLLALSSVLRRKKRGCTGCCGSCAGCSCSGKKRP